MAQEFDTKSHPYRKQRTTAVLWLVFVLAAGMALKVTVEFFLFLEIMLLVMFPVFLLIESRAYAELHFQGDRLFLTDRGIRKTYEIYDVPASDFVIQQSGAQAKKDRCDIKIKNTVFTLYDVDRCAELKQYIAENFPSC